MNSVVSAGEQLRRGEHNVEIGDQTTAGAFNYCFLFGDRLTARCDSAIIVGDHLFGVPMPASVQKLAKRHPRELEWILRKVLSVV